MNLITLAKLNELRFSADPRPLQMLQRWCRRKELPARKIGGEWYVDLDAFDKGEAKEKQAVSPVVQIAIDNLRKRRTN